jgi:hypothetical protein
VQEVGSPPGRSGGADVGLHKRSAADGVLLTRASDGVLKDRLAEEGAGRRQFCRRWGREKASFLDMPRCPRNDGYTVAGATRDTPKCAIAFAYLDG